MNYIFTSETRITEIKQKVLSDKKLRCQLTEIADMYMKQPTLSVTFNKSPAASGNPHDYFSEGTYWWPDEKNPGGPYIRRDGEVNPNVFKHHHDDMLTLCNAVCVLCQAGLYLDNTAYYKKAVELIRVWFLDDETKMNPHLEYGQAIRGICDGRSIGIIDTTAFVKLIYGADILDASQMFESEISQLKAWFEEYTNWLNTSEIGLEEKNYFNNHSNWWNTQVAAYCAFTGNDELLYECFDKFTDDILQNQIDENGIFVDEITRTLSYSYTIYNMTACAVICEIAHYRGVDLWNAKAPNGNSFKKSVEYFKPFYTNPFLWKYTQIKADGCFFENLPMKLAALRYNDTGIDETNQNRRKNVIPCSNMTFMGILELV